MQVSDARGNYSKLYQEGVPPLTLYRYSPKRGRVVCLVSQNEQGLLVAWDMCGECGSYFTKCSCKRGVSAPRSVCHIVGWAPAPRVARIEAPTVTLGRSAGLPASGPRLTKPTTSPVTSGKPLRRTTVATTDGEEKQQLPSFQKLDAAATAAASKVVSGILARLHKNKKKG